MRISYKVAIYALTIILFFTYLTVVVLFKKALSPAVFSLIYSTNPEEAAGFFSTFISTQYILIAAGGFAALIIIALFSGRINAFIRRILSALPAIVKWSAKIIVSVAIVIGAVDWGYASYMCTHPTSFEYLERVASHYVDNLTPSIYSTCMYAEFQGKVDEWAEINKKAYNEPASTGASEDLKIVLVIGESFIRSHSSLYGYHLQTNPVLQTEARSRNLLVYTDAMSDTASTTIVMRNVLCTNNTGNNEKWYDKPYFPLIFSKAGWRVNYWDNQTERAADGNYWNFSMSTFIFEPFLMEKCYTQIYEKMYPYDAESVDDFIHNAVPSEGNELDILHLHGQHFKSKDRFPKKTEFTKFTAEDIKRDETWLTDDKKQEIATYDNATLYNDFVIGKIIDHFRKDNAIIIYFSDHGEEIYDYRDSFGRIPCPENLKAQFIAQNSIPYFIWMSDRFMTEQPETAEALRKAVDLPVSNSDVAHLIMGIAKMKSPYYQPQCDLSSPSYTIRPRIVNELYDYDEITK